MNDTPLAERLSLVREQVADTARDAGRDPSTITTVVVTKYQPASLVRELAELGVRHFGESRHQEAGPKIAELADVDATWHFVGQLQSKKARLVREYVDVVHSLDRESLVDALGAPSSDSEPRPVSAFVQVNLTDDPNRGGVMPEQLESFIERVLAVPSITLLGLMAVAPLDESARRAFATVRALSQRVTSIAPHATGLSMGMSGDYRDAILEGATHLRIGTAITGNRPPHG